MCIRSDPSLRELVSLLKSKNDGGWQSQLPVWNILAQLSLFLFIGIKNALWEWKVLMIQNHNKKIGRKRDC